MVLEDIVLLLFSLIHIYISPFTKVEESFNLQATHDILFHTLFQEHEKTLFFNSTKHGFEAYDHFEFPGVVPRTFAGPLVLSSLSYPFLWILNVFFNMIENNPYLFKQAAFYATRISLSLLSVLSLLKLKKGVTKQFGKFTGLFLILLTCSQFHILYYMGRTLPNTFALVLVNYSVGERLLGNIKKSIFMLTFTTIVFRCDMILFMAPFFLSLLLSREISLFNLIFIGCFSAVVSLLCTISIDSYFWTPPESISFPSDFQLLDLSDLLLRPLGIHTLIPKAWTLVWPEGQVFYFNTVLNKSSEWGVLPFHWYFTNALVKSLLSALPFLPLALLRGPLTLDRSGFNLILPPLCFIFLYSFLPHKELRFILPVFPILNAGSAAAIVKFQRVVYSHPEKDDTDYRKRTLASMVFAVGILGLVMSGIVTSFFLYVSSHNYPGGRAISLFNDFVFETVPKLDDELNIEINAHFDTYSLMSGVSKFHHLPSKFRVGKSIVVYKFSKKNDEEFRKRLCLPSIGKMQFDVLFLDHSLYTSQKMRCQAAGYSVFESFGGEPRVNFWTIAFSIIPNNAVVVLVNKQSPLEPLIQDFVVPWKKTGNWLDFHLFNSYAPT
eukprot:snap_masked-scaffold_7-processed-gene-13.28-mRNA-1 protein AED:0.69 eAED:0.80 QI:0/-1/0/1/-1/1/1/0/607